jgi:predicted amidophosphoribosyltransferase
VPTVEQYTDPYIRTYTPVPRVTAGVCEVCHSWTRTRVGGSREAMCSSCAQTVSQVSAHVRLVVPFSLDVVGEQFHTVLWGYKYSQSESARARLRMQVAAIVARFLRDHGDCVRNAAGRDWTVMTIVPSSGARAGTHPLEVAVRMARAHGPLYRRLLERTAVPLERLHADEGAYRVTQDVEGMSVLLLDDTFTTGTRIQSAASALALAGAHVVAAITVGRVVRPDFSPEARALWDQQRATPFDFGTCCVHD